MLNANAFSSTEGHPFMSLSWQAVVRPFRFITLQYVSTQLNIAPCLIRLTSCCSLFCDKSTKANTQNRRDIFHSTVMLIQSRHDNTNHFGRPTIADLVVLMCLNVNEWSISVNFITETIPKNISLVYWGFVVHNRA